MWALSRAVGRQLSNYQLCLTPWIICLMVTSVKSAPTHYAQSSQPSETWLFDQIIYDLEQGQEQLKAYEHDSNELCPAVPKELPADACNMVTCSSDSDCQDGQLMCCHNGCIMTCLPHVEPAPHFDWIKEPIRQKEFGQSWLVPGPNDDINVQLCNTALPDDDSDPLVCPQGYTCSVDEAGDQVDSGICVKIEHDVNTNPPPDEIQNDQPSHEDLYDTALKHACYVDDGQLLISGHSLVLNGKYCLCQDKQLTCSK